MIEIKNPPRHVAFIMDGNGRWAKSRGLPRSVGHKKGAEIVKKIVEAASDVGVKYVTLYAFSTENWSRPQEEVDALMDLLRQYLKSEFKELKDKGVRIIFIGEQNMLANDIRLSMANLEKETSANNKLTLCIALSYGSRQEIVHAAQKIASMVKRGDISPKDIDIKMFSDMLYTNEIPDPDLLIRTSGEQRISNYLLWQLAYTELAFTHTAWPDFGKEEFMDILKNYSQRERRYGKL